ncbi:MAG: ABC-type transport system involved in cytochrome bd biosynthesis, ATpase and permease component [Sedimentibacter sp.]|jgi:putative ABC transport system ATP-binding protein|nr:ABC-type transport system involved in cytochrome bd biosynthesis, ATpase and permease component [Sedimentibacter sp.]
MFILKNVKYKNILDINNLEIKENLTACIVGESGSGKTTLLRLLNKMISCDSGEIYYNNKPLSGIDSVILRRSVVMLPQSPAIFKGTVRDNLLMGLNFSEKPAVSDEILKITLKTVKLNKDINDNADKLSGGEKQRLALGRILIMNPDVLLLDEPSSALDEDTENIIIEALVDFSRKNKKTLVMVTHSKSVAERFSDEIITIENGKLKTLEDNKWME